MYLGSSLTDNICHSNICPGNICPYKEYISCHWPDFNQTLKVSSWNHLSQMLIVTVTFVRATFLLATFVHIRNISAVTEHILTKPFGPNFLHALISLDPKFCWPTNFWSQNFLDRRFWDSKFLWTKNFVDANFLWTQHFLTKNYCRPKSIFWPQIILVQKVFCIKSFGSKKTLDQKYFLDQIFFQSENSFY